MRDNRHISEEDLYKLKEKDLEHISSCDYCLNKYMDFINKDLITAPLYMKENIIRATNNPYKKVVKVGKEKTRQIQLFIYSLKVATATIGALITLLIFTTSFEITSKSINQPPKLINETTVSTQLRENVDYLNDFLLNFSNTIIKTEDHQYDQKEK